MQSCLARLPSDQDDAPKPKNVHGLGVTAATLSQRAPATAGLTHRGPIAGIAAHGPWVATAGYDNQVLLWDAQTRLAIGVGTHDHLVNHCAFSHDGKWLLTASSDYSARVWALPSMRLHAVLADHGDDVDMAVFSADDRLIGTCALDRVVRVFDRHGRCLHAMRGHTGNVLSLAWSHDGQHLVTSSVDGTIRRWDVLRGVQVSSHDLDIRTDSLEITAEGKIFAGDDRGRIASIDGANLAFTQAHRAGIKKIVVDDAARTLVSLSYDRSMAVWRIEPEAGQPNRLVEISRTELPETIWARAAAILPNGQICAGTFGGSYATYDLHTTHWDLEGVSPGPGVNAVLAVGDQLYSVGDAGQVKRHGKPIADMGSLCNFLAHSDGHLYSGGQMGVVFDAQTGQALAQHHSPLNCAVAFWRHGRGHLAVGSYTGDILVFAIMPSGALSQVAQLPIYENAVKGLCVSGGQLFSVCACTDVAWVDIETLQVVRRLKNAHDRIANACCSLQAGQVASVSRDRRLRIWHDSEVHAYDSPHPNSIKCMATDEMGLHILSGSYGGTLALFDVRTRQWSKLSRPTHAGISSITWDQAQGCYWAGAYDGQVYRYQP